MTLHSLHGKLTNGPGLWKKEMLPMTQKGKLQDWGCLLKYGHLVRNSGQGKKACQITLEVEIQGEIFSSTSLVSVEATAREFVWGYCRSCNLCLSRVHTYNILIITNSVQVVIRLQLVLQLNNNCVVNISSLQHS